MENGRANPQTAGIREHRSARRKHALKGARIIFNHGSSSFSCTIRDLSDGGAKLVVNSMVAIPSTFDLRFDDGSSPQHCSVQWTSGTAIGVRFMSVASDTSPGRFGRR